jgi:hypothetical protein
MIWGSLSLPVWTEALMTSDRPVLRFLGLGADNAYIVMPIGPKHIFYAVNSPHVAQTLADYPAAKLAAEINTQIVEQAHRYVYATTDKPLPFVQQHMSLKPAPILANGYKLFPGGQRIEASELKRGKELRERYRDSPTA